MRLRQRLCAAYHIERSIANRLGLPEYPCACSKCLGAVIQKTEKVAMHHRKYGRDRFLQYPVLTIDGGNIRGPCVEGIDDGERYHRAEEGHQERTYVWPEPTFAHAEQMAEDAYRAADELHEAVLRDRNNQYQAEECPQGPPDLADNELLRESAERIYEGCSQSRLQATIVLMTMCTVFGVSNTFLDELLRYLAGDLLPKSNCLPRTSYEARRLAMKLGLTHESIHCCPDGHVLYRGKHAQATNCPKPGCGLGRYIPGSTSVPVKVVRYFSIIDRLRRMFQCPEIAKYLTWSSENKSEDGVMKSVVDGAQWAAINEKHPDFAAVATNLRLGLIGDGVNPFGNASTKHSIWPFVMAIYNLPPWLATKKFFISLVLIIPGPQAPTSDTVDIFLAPVVEDLQKLWDGVPAVNMAKPHTERQFTLRAILMWMVHDFPAFGLLSGQQTKGYKGCPVCGESTCADHSGILKKMIYLGSRRFLRDLDHRFRHAKSAFNNAHEFDIAPRRATGAEVEENGRERQQWLKDGGIEDSEDDPVKTHGVKRRSIFFDLPYWAGLPIRHTLDVMHCEKNICENLIKILFGENDKPTVRADLQARGIRRHLWLQQSAPGSEQYFMPDATYVLSDADKAMFLQTLKSIKFPSNYVSALHKKIEKGKLRGLKSHDYHVLLQQVLPVCLRNAGNHTLVAAIIRLSRVFQRICSESIRMDSKWELLDDIAETMCLLEKELPPGFFTIMMHLPVHIIEEVFLCGPVHLRWMYPFERYYKELKSYVRNLAKPEGSMSKGYELQEAMGYSTEYMANYTPTVHRVWDGKQNNSMVDEELEGKGKKRILSIEHRMWFHEFVCDVAGELEPYREVYRNVVVERKEQRSSWRRAHLHRRGRRRAPYPANLPEVSGFPTWLQRHVEDAVEAGEDVPDSVIDLSKLPKLEVTKYRSMTAFGNHFRVRSYEKHLSTCDSGVAAVFTRPCQSGVNDKNPITADLEYMGQVEEIVELNYRSMCVTVLVCSWVKPNYRGPNATVRRDKWGFTLANFNSHINFSRESFAFPKHCQQIFFGDAIESPGWKIVMRREVQGQRVDNLDRSEETAGFFAMGHDYEHEGLVPPPIVENEVQRPPTTGTNFHRGQILNRAPEFEVAFDADLGESSGDEADD